MRLEPNLANPSKRNAEREQINALGQRLDQLLQRMRRSHLNIELRLQRAAAGFDAYLVKPTGLLDLLRWFGS